MPKTPKRDDGFSLGGHDGWVFPEGDCVLKLLQPGGRGEREVRPVCRVCARNDTETASDHFSVEKMAHALETGLPVTCQEEATLSRNSIAMQAAFLECVKDHPIWSRFVVPFYGVREVMTPATLSVPRASVVQEVAPISLSNLHDRFLAKMGNRQKDSYSCRISCKE